MASDTHLVLIPSYNTGPLLESTVRQARQHWEPVWVVIDGSTDDSAAKMRAMAAADSGLEVLELPRNSGKGAAVLHGLKAAADRGFTHALTMDADGQHPARRIPEFMRLSQENPGALVLGLPVFDETAPLERLRGRRIANWFANLETLWAGIGDCLFGFRVYPIRPLIEIMQRNLFMRHFDFDPEAAVRLVWRGVTPLNAPAECRYFRPGEGGVSHFHYVRTNIVLSWMFVRLFLGFILRLPWLAVRRLRESSPASQRGNSGPARPAGSEPQGRPAAPSDT